MYYVQFISTPASLHFQPLHHPLSLLLYSKCFYWVTHTVFILQRPHYMVLGQSTYRIAIGLAEWFWMPCFTWWLASSTNYPLIMEHPHLTRNDLQEDPTTHGSELLSLSWDHWTSVLPTRGRMHLLKKSGIWLCTWRRSRTICHKQNKREAYGLQRV